MSAVRAIVVIGISSLCLLVYGPPMFAAIGWAYTGVHYPGTGRGSTRVAGNIVVTVDARSPAYRAGLRTGDVIACLSVADAEVLSPQYAHLVAYAGQPVRLCAEHNGAWRSLSFVPQRMERAHRIASLYGSPAMAALRLFVYVVFLFVGCALVMVRPSPMTWLLWVFCALNAPSAAANAVLVVAPSASYALLRVVLSIESDASSAVLALFALVVPQNTAPPGWRRVAFRIIAACALAIVGYAVCEALLTSVELGSIGEWLDEAFAAVTVAIVAARLATMEREERARFGWAAFAIVYGVVVNDVRNVVPSSEISTAAGLLTVVMPLALMYAILRRHVIDVRFVISRGVVYAAVTTLVVGLIGVVDWATSTYLHEARAALALDAAVTIALGFLLHRTYGWVESAVDFLLFRHKHEAGAYLQRLARTLPFAEHAEAVDRALVHDPYEKLDLAAAALFRPQGSRYVASLADGWPTHAVPAFERDDDIVRFLLAERTHLFVGDLRAYVAQPFRELGGVPALAVPIFARSRLIAFALYGMHRDGTQLDPDEIALLERLCEAAAQAYVSIELTRYEVTGAAAIAAMEPL